MGERSSSASEIFDNAEKVTSFAQDLYLTNFKRSLTILDPDHV
jgi:hypothetical protein